MEISKMLSGLVTIEYQDKDWIQTIDYEHIPFHCRKCHEHGHLFHDFPLNSQAQIMGEGKPKDGFTQVIGRKKQPRKKNSQERKQKISTNNSFDVLNQLSEAEEVENPHKNKIQRNDDGKSKMHSGPVIEPIQDTDSPAR
jgi:hypothetical protein